MKQKYICPSCLFYNKQTILNFKYVCSCPVCVSDVKYELNPIKKKLLQSFSNHSKAGFKCPDCERFLPLSLSQSNVMTCPFPNCLFSGRVDLLKRMRHPSCKENVTINNDVHVIKDTSPILSLIQDKINTLQYTSVNCTVKQKTFVYQAFASLVKKNPNEMTNYLLEGKRGDRLQAKLFQEYVSIVESNLPFSYKSNDGIVSVDSLTHQKFTPFDGLSKFDAIVQNNQTIKNNTSEIYIGNRKSYYCHPFYIGKLLDIVGVSGYSLMNNVKDYSFSIIRTDLKPGTKVYVSHLRIPSHYQVGILSHINRIKKDLTNSLNGKI